MSFNSPEAAFEAVSADHEARPDSAERCKLGELMIVKPDGARPSPGALWIMGFNGGETQGRTGTSGDTRSARRWFALCGQAAEAVGASTWIIGERTHWGSPNVGELVKRVGSAARFRALLRLHAEANRALLRAYPPSVVWMTGLSSYPAEAVEDYQLTPVGDPEPRDKRGRLWQEFAGPEGIPWLVTIHPTGARISREEFKRVRLKLATLADQRRRR